jgi:hypothetical protein
MPPKSRSEPPLPTELAFVVQFAADTAAPQGRFTGRVEHIVSGRASHFASREDLLGFIERVLTTLSAGPPGAPAEEPASEGMHTEEGPGNTTEL